MKPNDFDPIYRKTAQGSDEMRERRLGLPRKTFSLLLAIDGQRTRRQLCASLSAFGDVASQLDELLAQGLIDDPRQPPPPVDDPQPDALAIAPDNALEMPEPMTTTLSTSLFAVPMIAARPSIANEPIDAAAIDFSVIDALSIEPPAPAPAPPVSAVETPIFIDIAAYDVPPKGKSGLIKAQSLMQQALTPETGLKSLDLRIAVEQCHHVSELHALLPDYARALSRRMAAHALHQHILELLSVIGARRQTDPA